MSSFMLPAIPYIDGLLDCFSPSYTTNKEGECVVNASLNCYLNKMKESITPVQTQWDSFKRYANPYEFIHTVVPGTKQSVAKIRPLSRSFFKMHEMARSFCLLDNLPITGMKSYHIAEGPGGFIEAVARTRCNPRDRYHGITLVDDANPAVPGWKKTGAFLTEFPSVKIERGEDGTGDITNPCNLKACFYQHKASADLVTADGGFDFSLAYNHQETVSHRLIFAEVAFALATQKKGGSFVLKMFDMFTAPSIDILYVLCCLYEEVSIVKPNTSRYANSEKYVVCRGFRMSDSEPVVRCCHRVLSEYPRGHNMSRLLSIKVPYTFLAAVSEANAVFGQQQIETILSTLSLIDGCKPDRLESLKRSNVQRCVNWCQRNKVVHNRAPAATNIFLCRTNNCMKENEEICVGCD